MAALLLVDGFRDGLTVTDVVTTIALMAAVGFLEELLFRGFLLRAIWPNSNLTRAVAISGVTFGIGHVVNLARGSAVTDQLIQIVIGVAFGVVLALVVAVTRSIIVVAVFHMVFNTAGNLTPRSDSADAALAGALVVISIAYAVWLARLLPRKRQTGTDQRHPVAAARQPQSFVDSVDHETWPDRERSGHASMSCVEVGYFLPWFFTASMDAAAASGSR